MCLSETKQGYVVLKAFAAASRPLDVPELRTEIKKILAPLDLETIEDLGSSTLETILFDFVVGRATESAGSGKRRLTPDGVALMGAVEPLVMAAEPGIFVEPEAA